MYVCEREKGGERNRIVEISKIENQSKLLNKVCVCVCVFLSNRSDGSPLKICCLCVYVCEALLDWSGCRPL